MFQQSVLSLVFVTRIIVGAFLRILVAPIVLLKSHLPDSDSNSPSRLTRLKAWVHAKTVPRLPLWAEYRGNYTVLVKTTKGKQRLDRLVDSIPDRIFDLWERFSVGMMLLWLTVWSLILLAIVGLTVAFTTIEVVEFILSPSFDWLQVEPSVGDTDVSISLTDLLYGLLNLFLSLLFLVLIYCVVFLVLLPGIILHEFGHYAAARRANIGIQSYGLLFKGPLPTGAFVQPAESDLVAAKPRRELKVLAAGIGNTTLVALFWCCLSTVLYLTGIVTFGTFTVGNLVFAVVLTLALTELINSFVNAFPAGSVDGALFVETAKEQYANQT